MFEKPLTKSRRMQHYQVLIVVIVAAFLVLLTFMLLAEGRQYLGVEGTLLGWITRGIILLVAAGSIWVTYRNGMAKSYQFDGTNLIIQDSSFGATEQKKIVPLSAQNVMSMGIEQSLFAKLFDIGTIVIAVEASPQALEYRIENIDNAQAVLEKLSLALQRS